MKDFEIKITNNLPFIQFNNLKEHDLCPVTEKENSVLYILDDNCWEKVDDKSYCLKIKLRHAVNLDLKIRDLKDSGKIQMNDLHFIHLAKICSVHKAYAQSDLEKVEKDLYEKSLNIILKAIDEFNMASFMMGVSNE